MKRIILMVFKNIWILPYLLGKLFYYASHVEKYTEEKRYELIRKITHCANRGGNVEVKSSGLEKLPEQNGFLFFPNHQGLYDTLAVVEVVPRPFSVVAKKEVGNIFFLKQIFQCLKAFLIDREDVRQAMKVILEVSEEVKKGRNYLIFPEGTRSKEGNKVQEFKGGSFKAATKAKCPIVPVALVDCFLPFDRNTIKKVKVEVHVLDPIYPEEYGDWNTNKIAMEVKRRIEEKIVEVTSAS